MSKDKILKPLYKFNRKAEKLMGLKFTKQLVGANVQIKGHKTGLKIKRAGPKGEAFDSFILTYRFLIQDNDGFSFHKLAEVYSNEVIPVNLRTIFHKIRKRINTFLDNKTWISINNEGLTPGRIQDVLIYGDYAHTNNKEKEKTFWAWKSDPVMFGLVENEFVGVMSQMLYYIKAVRELNYKVIDLLDDSVDSLITHGLIIKEPWLGKILNKEKTWEVRSRNTKIRGRIYLIRSGSGQIMGSARLINSFAMGNADVLRRNKDKHCIPDDVLQEFLESYKKPYIWELRNVKKFETPMPYEHPKGAVVWVRLR